MVFITIKFIETICLNNKNIVKKTQEIALLCISNKCRVYLIIEEGSRSVNSVKFEFSNKYIIYCIYILHLYIWVQVRGTQVTLDAYSAAEATATGVTYTYIDSAHAFIPESVCVRLLKDVIHVGTPLVRIKTKTKDWGYYVILVIR